MDVRAIQAALCAARYQVSVDGDLGPQTYSALFAFVGRSQVTQMTAALGAAADKWLPPAQITTSLRLKHALAQWAVETGGFKRLEEDLDYSAQRLTQVWPSRYPTIAAATPYAGHPIALANKTYGGRFGNTKPNDGWTYRGRGPTQLTFRDNYAEAARLTGLDLLGDPDAVAEADTGLRVACAYWTARGINAAADRNDITAVRKAVNGGSIGLDEAKRYFARASLIIT